MPKYRKRPIVIEAFMWNGDLKALADAFSDGGPEGFILEGSSICILTLEGAMKANLRDYIIRGIKGEYYPCKPDIFHATYEEVE